MGELLQTFIAMEKKEKKEEKKRGEEVKYKMVYGGLTDEQLQNMIRFSPLSSATGASSSSSSAASSSSSTAVLPTTVHMTDLTVQPGGRVVVSGGRSTTGSTGKENRWSQSDLSIDQNSLEGKFAALIGGIATLAGNTGLPKWWLMGKDMDEKKRASRGRLEASNFNDNYRQWLTGYGIYVTWAMDDIGNAPPDAPSAAACRKITLYDIVRSTDEKLHMRFSDLVACRYRFASSESHTAWTAPKNALAHQSTVTSLAASLDAARGTFYDGLAYDSKNDLWLIRKGA